MSNNGSDVIPASKSYTECAVQTELPSPRQSPISPSSSPSRLDVSFDNLANGSLLFSDFGSPTTDAYTHSSPRLAVTQPSQRLAKPRLEPNRPSSTNIESNRIVSMPETAPVFQVKRELNHTARIVSMPSRPGETAAADLSISSDGTSGNTSSIYTATSLASIEESDVSIESVIIIEHNDGLAEGFLRPETIKEEVEDQEKTKSGHDQEWISWARSPPRPIPALHGPLSLPYARCPSGAEGTIIDEPENIPRMIWGLDTESQHSKPEPPALQSQPLSPPVRPVPSPAMFKQAVSTPVKISAPPPQPSVAAERGGYSGRAKEGAMQVRPPPGLQPKLQPASEDTVLDDPFGFKRVSPHVFHQQDDRHPAQDVRDVYPQSRGQAQHYTSTNAHTNLPRAVKAHDFPMSTTAGAMKVSARSAPGSALPQIVIEPRSPESILTAHHQPTAIELAHQYQRQSEQQALRNINPMSYLPTPPSSSSPLWSSVFSPYPESIPSPSLSDAHVLAQAIQRQQSQLRALEESEHLRRLVQERLSNINGYGTLEPAAHIDSLYNSHPAPQIDYSQLSSREDLLVFLARNERLAGVDTLTPAQPTVHTSRPRTLSDHSESPVMPISSREGLVSPSSLTNASYGLATPISPEITSHVPRGSITHQPRSIPLARLMQRRLSAVPEESDSSTIQARSPSPPLAVHGLGLESDKRQWNRRSDRAHGGRILAYDYVDKAPRAVEIERAPRGPDERSPRGFEGGRVSRGHNTERSSRGLDNGERQASVIDSGVERVKIRLPTSHEATDARGKLTHGPMGPRAPPTSGKRSQSSNSGHAQTFTTRSRVVDDRENDTEPPQNASRRRLSREPSRGSGTSGREASIDGQGRSQRKPTSIGAGRG